MKKFVLSLVLGSLYACADPDDGPVSTEYVREHGTYCCTHDGEPTTAPGSCSAPAGSVYLEDFSAVDASGRGDACGWLLKG